MPRWFRRKRWGYGWTPCTWQGWVATLLALAPCFAVSLPRLHLDAQTRLGVIVASMLALLVVTAFTSGGDSDA